MDRFVELVARRKSQAPPAWVMWEALRDPSSVNDGEWLAVQPDERRPTVIDAERPRRVTWSSIWTDHPELQIRFDLQSDGGHGSIVTWTLLGPVGALDDADLRQRRCRLDQLINGRLRDAFDQ